MSLKLTHIEQICFRLPVLFLILVVVEDLGQVFDHHDLSLVSGLGHQRAEQKAELAEPEKRRNAKLLMGASVLQQNPMM